MTADASILWFRQDLRIADNPALSRAASSGAPVLPVYIHCPGEDGGLRPGEASMWWLHHSLAELDAGLQRLGSRLIIRRGAPQDVLAELADTTGARRLFFNRRYEPSAVEQEKRVTAHFLERGVECQSFNSGLLFEPWQVATGDGAPYKVFTPFWKSCTSTDIKTACLARLYGPPASLPLPAWKASSGLSLDELGLLPRIDWAEGFRKMWSPGEEGAKVRLSEFLYGVVGGYSTLRDLPARDGVSYLSPHLHFGEISPARIWIEASEVMTELSRQEAASAGVFLKELGWREFAHHILYHFPETAGRPLRSNFERFPWRDDSDNLLRWQKGLTGYPIVDAGMRQLWSTGWMHNRVRMIVASFLTKDLRISWLEGARWFYDTLVDADIANNTLGWQWAAGCGADAAPYFRIFNPILQGLKFDPEGEYVKEWVPELENQPTSYIHKPWEAPPLVLAAAGVELGANYPRPVVDHGTARNEALQAFSSIKGS
ncbi:MAG: deoxyribodipyrimidine photo-lyase [Cyanobacteria bacterium HKST-UBA02]|nr:deoxyribodipyrimidine photo-lyase [Cyanobacteria bacterium HKST-UBA02]